MRKPKTPEDVRGYRTKCVNYVQCPICYGCRNYNNQDSDCSKCIEENSKRNICNLKLHRSDLIAKMVTHSSLKIKDEQITFKSFK